MLFLRATDTTNSRQCRYSTKPGLTVLLSSQMAVRECEGATKISWNEIMVKIREKFELPQCRYRYANPYKIKIYWFHCSQKKKIPFGWRYVTSIKITKYISRQPVGDSLHCVKKDQISYHSGPDSQPVWTGRINMKLIELCWRNANLPTGLGCQKYFLGNT